MVVQLSSIIESCSKYEKMCCNDTFTAAVRGHLNCLSTLHMSGIPWDLETCVVAALFGNIDCLRYAHEGNGDEDFVPCPWNNRTCIAAAQEGELECLQYAHEHGCPWDEITCAAAIFNGHLDCLRYAHLCGLVEY